MSTRGNGRLTWRLSSYGRFFDHPPVVDVHCHPFLNRGAISRRRVHRPDRVRRRLAASTWSRAASTLSTTMCGRAAAVEAQHDLLQADGPGPGRLSSASSRIAGCGGRGPNAAVAAGTRSMSASSTETPSLDGIDFRFRHPPAYARHGRGARPSSGRCRAHLPHRAADRRPAEDRYRLGRVPRRYDDTISDALTTQRLSRGSSRSSPTGPASTSRR